LSGHGRRCIILGMISPIGTEDSLKPEPKTEHYVPQFYLKYFTDAADQIYVFDKWDGRRFRTNISNIAAENYFYDIREIDEQPELDKKIVERELQRIESFYANEYHKLVDTIDKRRAITGEMVHSFSYYLTLQLLRTKHSREWIASGWKRFGQLMLDTMISQGKGPPPPEGIEVRPGDVILEILPEAKPEIQSRFMFDPQTLHGFAGILARHIWFVGINKSSQPFYTSDHPVATVPNKELGKLGYTGIAAPGVEIDFPITPDYTLVLLEKSFYEASQEVDRKYVEVGKQKVKDLNLTQLVNSYRQLYSKTPNVVLPRLICRKYPELCKRPFD
jgi:hypothetical protein